MYDWPVASINYRWGAEQRSNVAGEEQESLDLLDWPVPIHDVAFAYQWVTENLMPPDNGRGDIYVYGSHLGAGLAMGLSLTESYPYKRFSVRGVAAYNGVYNWTMFLPGHTINRIKSVKDAVRVSRNNNGNVRLDALQERLVSLFQVPSNLFDPFASPSLFFHNPGLLIPRSFYESTEFAGIVSAMKGQTSAGPGASAAPRKSYLVFPPRKSALRIPETMLLHDAPSGSTAPQTEKTTKTTPKKSARANDKRHTLKTQAEEIAGFMRRSINLVEMKQRAKWDEDIHLLADEPERRIQVVDVGQESQELDLNAFGQQAILDWLDRNFDTP